MEATVEAVDEAVLHWLARRDIMSVHAACIGPGRDRIAGQFAAIVTDHHLRLAAFDHEPIEFVGNPHAGQRRIRDQPWAPARAVVDDGQYPEATAIGQLIRPEVQ